MSVHTPFSDAHVQQGRGLAPSRFVFLYKYGFHHQLADYELMIKFGRCFLP